MKQISKFWSKYSGRAGLLCAAALIAGCASTAPQGPSASIEPTLKTNATSLSGPVIAERPQAQAVTLGAPASDSALSDSHADIWARLRAGFSMPELDTPLVQDKERFYLANRDALNRMFTRGGRYLHYIVEEVERRGMPAELALLPFVESAMNPVAISSAKAAGLWQFIPSTGKQYNLSQNWWVDNRRDVVQSTNAALDYLQKIYEMNERDWFLALASYNWGENAVARAVKNNRARGLPVDYLSLSMPAETRHYVPKLIALKHIIQNADALGVALPAIPNKPYFVTIEKTRPIDLKLAAQYAGMSVDEFVALNPAHNRPVIAASRNNQIKVPADKAEQFTASIAKHDQSNKPMASWQPYTLQSGESLDDVARRGNVSTQELLKANGMRSAGRIMPGTQVIAPQSTVQDERQVESFSGPKIYEQITLSAVYHRVQRRESLPAIAANYGVSADTLSAWNGGVRTARAGSSLLVRPAVNQTVLTSAAGDRQVVGRGEVPMQLAMVRTDASAPVAAAPILATAAVATASLAPRTHARAAPVSTKSAPRSTVNARATAPVARATPDKGKAATASTQTVKTVLKPADKPAAAKAAPVKVSARATRT